MLTISLFPIPIHADTITTANIVGVSAVVSDSLVNGQVTFNSTTFNTFRVNYDIEVIFDQAYLGYVQLTLEYDYYTRDSTGIISRTENQTRRVFVNGTSAHINLNIFSSYNNAPLLSTYNNPRISTITTGGTNVTPIGDLSDLQQIVDILQDIYSLEGDIEGLENNQLLQLQQVVANTSLANDYLETLTKIRQWNFPIESFGFIYPLLYNNKFELVNIGEYDIYSFPIFKLINNTEIYSKYINKDTIHIVFGTVAEYLYSSLLDGFEISFGNYIVQSSDIKNFKQISRNQYTTVSLPGISEIISFDVIKPSNVNNTIKLTSKNNNYFMPIYFSEYNFISTDFALRFGLSNSLLDNINIIANGTSSSSSSSSDLDDTTSQFQTDANSLISIEDSFNSSMNSNLDNINPTFSMGSSFLASANWVSTQFNRIVNNTPFSSLITFGLTLGLGLLIIGKIRK